MFCKNCGATIPQNAKFCPKCGAIQGGKTKKSSSAKDTNQTTVRIKRGSPLPIVLIVLVVALLIGGGLFVWLKYSDTIMPLFHSEDAQMEMQEGITLDVDVNSTIPVQETPVPIDSTSTPEPVEETPKTELTTATPEPVEETDNLVDSEADVKPVSITSLTPVNNVNWDWNSGEPVDPFGNDFSDACNYTILSNGGYRDEHYIEYRLYGEYSKIVGTLVPYTTITEDGYSFLQVFSDDVLQYTSPTITRKTDAFTFEIDVTDVEYLKLNFFIEWDSSVILSDVQLVPHEDNSSTTDDSTVVNTANKSITALTNINQHLWDWNQGFPSDYSGTDYTRVCNYVILANGGYRDDHYTEYRLYGEYSTLRGTIAPYTTCSEEGSGYLQVYADDVLVYTSPTLEKRTDTFEFEIDVSGVEYLKLDAYVDWDSSIIISNLLLEP